MKEIKKSFKLNLINSVSLEWRMLFVKYALFTHCCRSIQYSFFFLIFSVKNFYFQKMSAMACQDTFHNVFFSNDPILCLILPAAMWTKNLLFMAFCLFMMHKPNVIFLIFIEYLKIDNNKREKRIKRFVSCHEGYHLIYFQKYIKDRLRML